MPKKVTKRPAPAVRKHQILKAGLTVARALGYSGLTFKAIADVVGISAPSVVYHYHTMPQLKRAVMRHAIAKGDALVIAMGVEANDRHAQGAPEELRALGAKLALEWEPCDIMI